MRNTSISDTEFDSILVMSLAGVGDTIMATPVYQAIRDRYPGAAITALTMFPASGTVLRRIGAIDHVIAHNFLSARLSDSMGLVLRLRKRRFDLSVLTFPANRGHYNILARAIGARYRLGHDYAVGNSVAYGRFLLTHRVPQPPDTHNVEHNKALAEALGADCSRFTLTLGRLGNRHAEWAREYLRALGAPPYVGIHPGCSPGKNHTRKRWPAKRFAALVNELKAHGATPLVFLGPDEGDLAYVFAEESPGTPIVDGVGLERVTAILKASHLLVGNDCSLAHLAAACGKPVVSVFGPTSHVYARPWGVPTRIVRCGMSCSPCFELSRRPLQCATGKDYACIRDIPVSAVLEATVSLLSESRYVPRRDDPPLPPTRRTAVVVGHSGPMPRCNFVSSERHGISPTAHDG